MFFDKIPELTRKEGLYLKDIPEKGRGVFCRHDIKKGEVIEITPGLLLKHEKDIFKGSVTKDYVFAVDKMSKSLKSSLSVKSEEEVSLLAMGISSFCNHSPYPNLEYNQIKTLYTIYFKLIATMDIAKDTELCISYGKNWFATRK